MSSFIDNSGSRERLPDNFTGRISREQDPARRTMWSRLKTISDAVMKLELSPEVRAMMSGQKVTPETAPNQNYEQPTIVQNPHLTETPEQPDARFDGQLDLKMARDNLSRVIAASEALEQERDLPHGA